MTPRDRQTLDELVRVTQSQAPPKVDAARMGMRLTAAFRNRVQTQRERGEASHAGPAAKAGPGRYLGFALVGSLVLAVGWVAMRGRATEDPGAHVGARASAVSRSAPPAAPARAAPTGADQVQSPRAGRVLVAGPGGLRVQHADAWWKLAAGSTAAVLSNRPGSVQIELRQGRLDARVTPGSQADSFIVRAGDTEVAVRGTQFSVERGRDAVEVSVGAGVVAVRARGSNEETRLSAGDVGRFRHGRRLPEELDPAASMPARTIQRAQPAQAGARPRGGSERGPAEDEPRVAPAGEPAERAFGRVRAELQTCFERHTPDRGGLSIVVESQLSLEVRRDGSILGLYARPPLAPAVAACASAALREQRLPASSAGYRVERPIRLGR